MDNTLSEDDIKNGCLSTMGINSSVYEDRKKIGHVGFYDFDEVDYNEIVQDIGSLGGINVLSESSKGRYHCWNLSIKSKERIFVKGVFLNADLEHLKIGFMRDGWILRIYDKKNVEGLSYKQKPTIKCIWYNPTSYIQSKPHFDIIKSLLNRSINVPDIFDFRGDSVKAESYCTYTDELKRKLYKKQV